MQIIYDWAKEWGVNAAAANDLIFRVIKQAQVQSHQTDTIGSENAVQAAVRLEAQRHGVTLWRNNVGVLEDKRGVPVRFGLCNDTKKLNEHIKSGDLIGIKRVLIEPHHVGTYIGQFISRECKHSDWKYTNTAHEQAQLRWQQVILANGGDAKFTNGEGSFK